MSKSTRSIVKDHFELFNYIKEAPRRWDDIIQKFGWSKSTTSNRLNLLIDIKMIKKPENKYMSFDYEDIDEKIKFIIKENRLHELGEDYASSGIDALWDGVLKPSLALYISKDNESAIKERFRDILKETIKRNLAIQ